MFFTIVSQSNRRAWLLPILILTFTLVCNVLISGWLEQNNQVIDETSLPPDFQYYSAEQQAQYMQAMEATKGPVFVYIFPLITSLFGLLISWLLFSGLIHLGTTLLGGLGNLNSSLNIVAWSSLPLGIRDIVRSIFMLVTRSAIDHPGISGFAPQSTEGWATFLFQLLSRFDIYLLWMLCLLILGLSVISGLKPKKAILCGLFSALIVLIIQAMLGFAAMQLGNLNIIRPFFF